LAEYRIVIGSKTSGSGRPPRLPGKLAALKAVLLGLLGLAVVIGIVLAAFVIGSLIASVLLILVAIALIIWVVRRLLLKFQRSL
jgi:hypothetical protein